MQLQPVQRDVIMVIHFPYLLFLRLAGIRNTEYGMLMLYSPIRPLPHHAEPFPEFVPI
jgi:hypothetical protein